MPMEDWTQHSRLVLESIIEIKNNIKEIDVSLNEIRREFTNQVDKKIETVHEYVDTKCASFGSDMKDVTQKLSEFDKETSIRLIEFKKDLDTIKEEKDQKYRDQDRKIVISSIIVGAVCVILAPIITLWFKAVFIMGH